MVVGDDLQSGELVGHSQEFLVTHPGVAHPAPPRADLPWGLKILQSPGYEPQTTRKRTGTSPGVGSKPGDLAPGKGTWVLPSPGEIPQSTRDILPTSSAPGTAGRWALITQPTQTFPGEAGGIPCSSETWGVVHEDTPACPKPAQTLPTLTCLQSEAMRLRLLVEMVRVMGMPANFRLLLPRMEFRERLQG